jgi:transposase-like protein
MVSRPFGRRFGQSDGHERHLKSQVSWLCQEIDEKVKAFLGRPIEGDWPYLWIDATYLKGRQSGRIVSVAVIVAVGVNSDGPPRSAWHGYRTFRGRDLLD